MIFNTHRTTKSLIGLILFGTLLFSGPVQAQSISKVKDKQAVIELGNLPAAVGTEFYTIDKTGKKVGILKVTKVVGQKAAASIEKGKVEVGMTVTAKAGTAAPAKKAAKQDDWGSNNAAASTTTSEGKNGHLNKGFPIAIMLGFSSNTMSLKAQYDLNGVAPIDKEEEIALKGTGPSFKIMGEFPMGSRLFARGFIGYETFTAAGTGQVAVCDDGTSTTCSASFNYIGFEGSGHLLLTSPSSTFRMHIGGGYSYLKTSSKSVNIPNLKAGGDTNQIILAKLGFDFISRKSFIPVSLEYGYIPGDNVKASGLYLRLGYGFYM